MEDTISSTFRRKHKKVIKQKQKPKPHLISISNTKRKPMIKKKKPNKISTDSTNHNNHYNNNENDDKEEDEEEDCSCNGSDEKEEVERKIRALQRIVPGGESLGVDQLFQETAGYIMALQSQLKAMKTLASFFQGLHKQRRKFGA